METGVRLAVGLEGSIEIIGEAAKCIPEDTTIQERSTPVGIAERWKRFRELPEDMERALGRLTPLFEEEGVLLAYVFGSLAKGRKAHDVDIAILMREKPAYLLRGKISECLGTERLMLHRAKGYLF